MLANLIASVFVASFASLMCVLIADEDDFLYRHHIMVGVISGAITFALFTLLWR